MRLFCALSLLLFSVNVFAATVTVSMCQNEGAPTNSLEMTRVIEGEIMNEYFNSGQIVSNTQIIEGAISSSVRRSLVREAAAGMSDFLMAVYLEYDRDKKIVTDTGVIHALLKKVEWQVIDVSSSRVVGSGSFAIEESEIPKRNPNEAARAAARRISRESLEVQHGAGRRKR